MIIKFSFRGFLFIIQLYRPNYNRNYYRYENFPSLNTLPFAHLRILIFFSIFSSWKTWIECYIQDLYVWMDHMDGCLKQKKIIHVPMYIMWEKRKSKNNLSLRFSPKSMSALYVNEILCIEEAMWILTQNEIDFFCMYIIVRSPIISICIISIDIQYIHAKKNNENYDVWRAMKIYGWPIFLYINNKYTSELLCDTTGKCTKNQWFFIYKFYVYLWFFLFFLLKSY